MMKEIRNGVGHLAGITLSIIAILIVILTDIGGMGKPTIILVLSLTTGIAIYELLAKRKASVELRVLKEQIQKTQNEKQKLLKTAKIQQKKLKQLDKKSSSLQDKVHEAESIQQEMKDFADMQIKTNEQLMIAEGKLKSLLEKEKESKAILNQTLEQLKDTQGQLVHSEKMASLGQLTAGIAHEINNPINFVYNGIGSLQTSLKELSTLLDKYAELDEKEESHDILDEIKELKEEFSYNDLRSDLDELLVDIKEGAIRTIEIVKGLRVFSRLDEEERKEANVNECLEATLVLLKNKTKNRIQVSKELDPDLPPILCYPGQLNQVFMNIINNAIQALPDDNDQPEISVTSIKTEHGIEVKLKDNGIGMNEEVQQRIFEPFFTTKPVGVGTGLGMSISYGIIEKHAGELSVKSELGKGTEFTITLPNQVSEYSKAI